MDKEARERLDYEYEKKFDLFKKIYTFLDKENNKQNSILNGLFDAIGYREVSGNLSIVFDEQGLNIQKIDINK